VDDLPAGTVLNSLGAGCSATLVLQVTCSVPALSAGQSQSFTIVVVVTAPIGTTLTNTAQLTPTGRAAGPNDAATTTTTVGQAGVVFPPGFAPPVFFGPGFESGPGGNVSTTSQGEAASAPGPPPPPPGPPPPPVGVSAGPPAGAPAAPPAQPGQLWLVMFQPTQTYSLAMDPLWETTPGEWYVVLLTEDGWVLARWEGDPPEWVVWIEEGPAFAYALV
jgi:hypothetical protein